MSMTAQQERISTSDMTRKFFALLVPLVLGAIVLTDLAINIIDGGSNWKQGDWLINSHLEHVRRGLLGSWILMTADVLHANPLYVLAALQATILVILIACMAFVLQALAERREFYLLITSPGFFLIFWAADPQGALRKELLVYCALALALTYPLYRSRFTIALATVLFVVGCVGHEANVLFLPLFAAVLFLISTDAQDQRFIRACGLIAAIGATISLAYGLYFARVEDISTICRPLTDRGMPESMCKGAIRWLDRNTAYGISRVVAKFEQPARVLIFPIMYAMALAPLFYFAWLTARTRQIFLIYGLSVLPFLPLYVIATDWGRWMNWHITSAIFLILAMALTGRLQFARQATSVKFTCLTLLGLMWAAGHEEGTVFGGLLARLFRDLEPWLLSLS
jgi:hypothetical protein